MIVLDANLLIYAYRLSSPDHARAREWAEGIFSGDELVGLPWQTISAFARIVTNPNLAGDRFSTTEAISIIQEWMEMPGVRLLLPASGIGLSSSEFCWKGRCAVR